LNLPDECIIIFTHLINTFFNIKQEHDDKIELEDRIVFTETITSKFLFQSYSIKKLLEGMNVKPGIEQLDVSIVDISSIYILIRSQIENYLTYFYLYKDPKTDEEAEFRFLLYKIAGLTARQKQKAIQDTSIKIKQNEKEELEQLLIDLKNNKYFIHLRPRTQKHILRNKPSKLKNWGDLLTESHLSEDLSRIWYQYSNHAHSEYYSMMQIRAIQEDTSSTFSTRNLILFVSLVLISLFIVDYKNFHKEIEKRFNSFPEDDRDVISLLKYIGTKQSKNK